MFHVNQAIKDNSRKQMNIECKIVGMEKPQIPRWNKGDLKGENEAEEIIVNDSISQHFKTAHYRNGSSFKHITSIQRRQFEM